MSEIVDSLRSNATSNRRQADSAVRMAGPTALVGEAIQLRKNADCLDSAADTIEAQSKLIEELRDFAYSIASASLSDDSMAIYPRYNAETLINAARHLLSKANPHSEKVE